MAKIIICSNYEIVNGIKVFGEMKERENRTTPSERGVNDFDAAKNALWDAFDKFREDFNFPTHNGVIYEFSRTEMDLDHDDNHEYFGSVEGFEYDDGVTMWSATIYEKCEF